jgi:hydroxysqualene dehydroxylase
LISTIWREIAPALGALGIHVGDGELSGARLVKEKRATIRQAAGPLAQPPIRPFANLVLAGDWIGSLPATIETAVVSGERAVHALERNGFASIWTTGSDGMLPVGDAR